MRGRKPKIDNVVPMREATDPRSAEAREQATREVIKKLMPRGMSKEMQAEWKRVARVLADPTVDRLKPRYVDVIREYCQACVRLRTLREAMPTVAAEVYRVKSRNGDQIKSHPFVAQVNEQWRQWRSLVAMLGLSPTDERNLLPGQGDLFDEADQYFS
ncbi:MAG: P27 family phage terminase small subunit [Rhizobiaceae bacterium]